MIKLHVFYGWFFFDLAWSKISMFRIPKCVDGQPENMLKSKKHAEGSQWHRHPSPISSSLNKNLSFPSSLTEFVLVNIRIFISAVLIKSSTRWSNGVDKSTTTTKTTQHSQQCKQKEKIRQENKKNCQNNRAFAEQKKTNEYMLIWSRGHVQC